MTDLNSLPRELAERLIPHACQRCDDDECCCCNLESRNVRTEAEAVIREAIDKTLEAAARAVEEAYQVTYGNAHDSTVANCREAFAQAIRSLKQSNSGRAEQREP